MGMTYSAPEYTDSTARGLGGAALALAILAIIGVVVVLGITQGWIGGGGGGGGKDVKCSAPSATDAISITRPTVANFPETKIISSTENGSTSSSIQICMPSANVFHWWYYYTNDTASKINFDIEGQTKNFTVAYTAAGADNKLIINIVPAIGADVAGKKLTPVSTSVPNPPNFTIAGVNNAGIIVPGIVAGVTPLIWKGAQVISGLIPSGHTYTVSDITADSSAGNVLISTTTIPVATTPAVLYIGITGPPPPRSLTTSAYYRRMT